MRRFAQLFDDLDTTTSTSAKVDAMIAYFHAAPSGDAAWAAYVLIGRRPKRLIGPALLRKWLSEEAALPAWLVEETYASVGDLAETIALLIERDSATTQHTDDVSLEQWFTDRLLPLARCEEVEQRASVTGWWRSLPYRETFLVNKLLTGSLRVGVSRSLVTRALAEIFDRPRTRIERALIGEWFPDTEFWERLRRDEASTDVTQPYPFFLASPLEGDAAALGERDDWLAEWKWDGIRGQIVRRGTECALWSRGEEVITERFPEILQVARTLPEGTVLDGEVLAWSNERVAPFAQLQRRIGRRAVSAKIMADVPVRFLAFDLLEHGGEDWRTRSLRERREKLDEILEGFPAVIGVSKPLDAADWDSLGSERQGARALGVEGLMLKSWTSAYGTGRQRGTWWKWKIEPFSFDAVLLYAAPGHGRRSNLYTDYTFAVWSGDALVPVAKAYSGLTDEEIRTLDRWIRTHTKEKFGPVRSLEPTHVFELAFEGIAASPRHKSGIALRFPRMLRWRTDKKIQDADTLADLQRLLAEQSAHGA